jgi:hypothetical protein
MIISKRIWALVMVAVMIFALSGCNKIVLDADDFEDVLEVLDADDFEDFFQDFDFEVYTEDDVYLSKDEVKKLTARDDDYDFIARFIEFDEEDDAKNEYDDILDDLQDAEDDNDYEGSIQTSKSGNYNKYVLKGEFDEDIGQFPEGNVYAVMYRIGNIGFIVLALDNDARDVKEVNAIVKELGY